MQKKLIRIVSYLGIIFTVMFLFRLLYGYLSTGNSVVNTLRNVASFQISKNNYASRKLMSYLKADSTATVSVDQKYEKIASLASYSTHFEKDEMAIRASIKEYKALIQFEQKVGLKGRRSLRLGIGVPPDNFEAMLKKVKTIGKLTSIQIDKKDKTNEYKSVTAKRKSLEKTITALKKLKNRSGNIDELIKLENRILEMEEKIQKLGVELGDYDAENEFVTIKFSLSETKERSISFIHRIKVALEWTIKYYLLLVILFMFGSIGGLAFLAIIEKLGWLPEYAKKTLGV